MSIKVEIFSSPNCNTCDQASQCIQQLATEINHKTGSNMILWCKVNVVEEIDRAVSLGVLSTPAIVIDNSLVFTGLPSTNKLRQTILKYLNRLG